jgi:CRISPR-associated protein Csh1
MLNEVIEAFKKKLKEKDGESIIYGDLKKGTTYVLVDKDWSDDKYEIYYITGNKEHDISEIGIDKYREIAKKDFMSHIILSKANKCIDSKKAVHSTNYMTFFIKKNRLKDEFMESKEEHNINKVINSYFASLDNHIDDTINKKDSQELFNSVNIKLKNKNEEIFNKNKQWLEKNLLSIRSRKEYEGPSKEEYERLLGEKYKKPSSTDIYIKVFFNIDNDEIYENEYNRYFVKKVFNDNNYNIVSPDGVVYGLHNGNMNLNNKKPSLSQATRKNKLPNLVSLEEAIIIIKFFYFLESIKDNTKTLYFNEEGMWETYIDQDTRIIKNTLRLEHFNGYAISWNKDKEINRFDIVKPSYVNKTLKYEKVVDMEMSDGDNFYTQPISITKNLEHLVDKILFDGNLCINYYTENIDIKDMFYKKLITEVRDAMYRWFVVGDSKTGYEAISKNFNKILINAIIADKSKSLKDVRNKFNLICSLRAEFEGDEFKMKENKNTIREQLKDKINLEDTPLIESDAEYYYAVGQVSKFLIKQKKSRELYQSEFNPILKCKTDEKLKSELVRMYELCNHSIFLEFKRFNKIYSMVLDYNPTNKTNIYMLLAGFLDDVIILSNKNNTKEETIKENIN